MPDIMIMSLGGSPVPLSKSIEMHKPARVVFLASHDSVAMAGDVLRNLSYSPPKEFEITENPNLLSECYNAAKRCVDRVEKWKTPPDHVVVDYTGGTKVMTAALILATVGQYFRFNYVGGEQRNKNGVGVVMNGHEKLFAEMSPWSVFAEEERRQIVTLFNRRRYAAVIEIISLCMSRELPARIRDFFRFMRPLAEGFLQWDQFMHREANASLESAIRLMTNYLLLFPDEKLRDVLDETQKKKAFLSRLIAETDSLKKMDMVLIADLMNNAHRRMADRRFDDAAARIYRALELYGQIRFEAKTGVANDKVAPEVIPEEIREKYLRKYGDSSGKVLKLPLEATYRCLAAMGDESGKQFLNNRDRIKSIQSNRNQSILAHGINPVTEKAAKAVFETVTTFVGLKDSDYFSFPVFPS